MGEENTRIFTADDLVGILIHRCNTLAANLSVNGVNANWEAVTQHVIGMYQDIERVKSMMQPPASADQSDAPAQPN